MLIEVEDESVDQIIVAEMKDSLANPYGLSKKAIKAFIRVMRWYMVHTDWDEYKKSEDYKFLKKEYGI